MNNLSYLLDQKDLKNQPKELQKICQRMFYKGKGLRSQIVNTVGSCLLLNKKKILFLSRIIEYIHNASLLHDDFIDQSKIRRNYKSAWLEFSPSQAVLAGDYLLGQVSLFLAEKKDLELIKTTAKIISELTQGEFLQRELFGFKDKVLKKRNRVIELKTACLFKWCLKTPFLLQKRKESKLYKILNRIGKNMGLLFQRSDDLIDFSAREEKTKTVLSDLKQKYYNSFSCFLLESASWKTEKTLQNTKTLSELHSLFPNLKTKIQDFDQINLKMIHQTKKEIRKLEPFLKNKEQSLIQKLEKLSDFLYWRK